MAKPTILKERGTGEEMYPHTLASLVKTSTGENVDEAVEAAKFKVFVDMWNQAWNVNGSVYGKYDPDNAPDSQHPFMGNRIWMTYEEALGVMHHSVIYAPSVKNLYMHKYPPCRTLLPTVVYGLEEDYGGMYGYCTKLETIRIQGGYAAELAGVKNVSGAFYVCTALREVLGTLDFSQCSTRQDPASAAKKLEGLYISHLHVDLKMATNPKWRLDCVAFVVENAANTSPITITVHADVYAKLTGDTTNEAAAALTEEELAQWQQVLADAVAKNISFATI